MHHSLLLDKLNGTCIVLIRLHYFSIPFKYTESMDSAVEATDFFHEDANISDKGEHFVLHSEYSDC